MQDFPRWREKNRKERVLLYRPSEKKTNANTVENAGCVETTLADTGFRGAEWCLMVPKARKLSLIPARLILSFLEPRPREKDLEFADFRAPTRTLDDGGGTGTRMSVSKNAATKHRGPCAKLLRSPRRRGAARAFM